MQPSQSGSNQYEAFLSARLPKVEIPHLKFQSASEYACAHLLERYCNWKAFPGVTFQVPVGRCFVDFRVGNCLVEYHPISLRHEFITGAIHDIQRLITPLSKDRKGAVLDAIAEELRAQYVKRRGQVASASPAYKDCEVVCCFSPEEFIAKVVMRHRDKTSGAIGDLLPEFLRLQQEGRRAAREQ